MSVSRETDSSFHWLSIEPQANEEVCESFARMLGAYVFFSGDQTRVLVQSSAMRSEDVWQRGAAILSAAGHSVEKAPEASPDILTEATQELAEDIVEITGHRTALPVSLWQNPSVLQDAKM